MSYTISQINRRLQADPLAFIAECAASYEQQVLHAADQIQANLKYSPIVLLAGPSGSGKTTTAMKIDQELERRGILTHTISMDNYFRDVRPELTPRSADGTYDFESPDCLDLPLLNAHFDAISRAEPVTIPAFDFLAQARSKTLFTPLHVQPGEAVIFEGIHALNPAITGEHPEAARVYVSPETEIPDDNGAPLFFPHWLRLVRRTVRDHQFRGAAAEYTLQLWANVRRGEELYISPYKDRASITLDTTHAFEPALFKSFFPPLLPQVPDTLPNAEEYRRVLAAFDAVVPLAPDLLPADSLMREFVGSGLFSYERGVN